MRFTDRVDAGRRLARLLGDFRSPEVVVVGLPRGGVPVAFEVAQALRAPLDVIVVRKLGVPDQPELAMGAIGEGGERILNQDVIRMELVRPDELAEVEAAEHAVLTERAGHLRAGRPPVPLAGRTVLIVDDGVATGSTARVACRVARARGARRVVLAVPVVAADVVDTLRQDADDVISVGAPRWLSSVGEWYDDFAPTTDEDVRRLLRLSAAQRREGPGAPAKRDTEVVIPAGPGGLGGHLVLPADASGIVVFVHGSGSSRHSPRNQFVATRLNEAGLGTLLFDLLTAEEELDRTNVFDIELLAARLTQVTGWLRGQPWAAGQRVGWFGASTGAGAALWAAAEPAADVAAIVSRGGRPDLAEPRLAAVRAPTLLIVGGLDHTVLNLNRRAQRQLRCPSELAVVPGATHLFEEAGTLARAADLASDWFVHQLQPVGAPGSRR
jgi:putative phosphoribosyl transferase